jgi:hypothetical protein
MISDSINEEILQIKRELAAKHGNDVARIVADARARQGKVVTRAARPYNCEQGDAPIPPSPQHIDGSSTPAVG